MRLREGPLPPVAWGGEVLQLSRYWRQGNWTFFRYLKQTVRGYMDVLFWD